MPAARAPAALALALAGCTGGGSDDTTSSTSITVPMTSGVTDPGTTDGTTDAPPTTSTTASPTTSDATTDAPPKLDVGGLPDVPPDLQCSADLHAVVDGLGQVVEACAPEQGCADGVCVAACAAAAASKANFGCEFHVPTPPTHNPTPPCFAAFVTNTWGHPAHFEVARDGVDLDPAIFARVVTDGLTPAQWPPVPPEGLAPGAVAVLFLSGDPMALHPQTDQPLDCPVDTAVLAGTELKTSGRGATFDITSDIPLTAYDIAPFGGALSYIPSAELLFPASAYGKNYVTIVPPIGTDPMNKGPLWLQIVGRVDGTQIEIRPTATLEAGGGVEAAPAGQVTAFTVDAGEYLQWHFTGDGGSGTLILADQDIAVHTGNRFLRLQPVPSAGGESTHQQNNPVTTLGQEYVAAPYATRRFDLAPETIEYRVVGVAETDTELTYDPPVPGAPTTLAQGETADFATDQAFRVRSQDDQHPFVLAQIMDTCHLPGGTRDGATADIMGIETLLGDEEFVILLPPAQFLQKYVFFTDPSFSTTNLVLTRVDRGDGFKDVTVDCLGTVTGWQPVGADATYEVTTVDLVRAEEGNNGCTNGGHTAESDGPFGLVVWGLDNHSSYAYPAGGNAKPLTDLVIPPN